ncbi:MAG: hypothetical protein ACE5I7_20340, partial [Candidatus Binatia bacterium]
MRASAVPGGQQIGGGALLRGSRRSRDDVVQPASQCRHTLRHFLRGRHLRYPTGVDGKMRPFMDGARAEHSTRIGERRSLQAFHA